MPIIMGGKAWIGTSGWHYKHWLGVFYPQKLASSDYLSFYARHFNTVELNNSFYHLPSIAAFDNWRDSTPPGFRYAVKGSRFITHMKKLKDPETSTSKFFDGVAHLENKVGPILFQLPPRWHINLARLEEFLTTLPYEYRYVFEFRDESWFDKATYRILRQHNAAFCVHDLSDQQTPLEVTADFAYVRFHGPGIAKYAGSYSTASLKGWARRIEDWLEDLSDVYLYFNNDIGGWATKNALELKRLLPGKLA